jgi:hypothetical protein
MNFLADWLLRKTYNVNKNLFTLVCLTAVLIACEGKREESQCSDSGSTASAGGSTASAGGSTASAGGSTASAGGSTASAGGSTASAGGDVSNSTAGSGGGGGA